MLLQSRFSATERWMVLGMAEYIERSKIFSVWRSMPAPASVTSLSAAIHQTPAIEIVRCKDCAAFEEKYRTVGEETGTVYCGGYCYHWDYEPGMSPNQVDGDDFCSRGERKTEC